VDDDVRQVDTHDVLGGELPAKARVGEELALAHELSDLLDGVFLLHRERKDHVRYSAVGNLLIHRQLVAAPVAARLSAARGVDDDLGPARGALEREDLLGRGRDVRGPGTDDDALEGRSAEHTSALQ